MVNVIYSGIGLLLTAICGLGVIYYKRNRRKLKCLRVKYYLTAHPTNGIPSEYFIDAFERKFNHCRIEESKDFIKVKLEHVSVAYVQCKGGILKIDLYCSPPENNEVHRFLKEWNNKEEWKAVSSLMDCGCYCMKM